MPLLVCSCLSESGPDSPRVFLASLKAAGQGTNLTAASQVFMLDPWWNPSVEDQAMVGISIIVCVCVCVCMWRQNGSSPSINHPSPLSFCG